VGVRCSSVNVGGAVKSLRNDHLEAMTIYNWLITALWLMFIAYWAVMGVHAKRTIGARFWGREAGLRVAVVVLVLLALRLPVVRHALRNTQTYAAAAGPLLGLIAVVLCAFGIGLAIWARSHLGRNWGMPMARKESPELVISGPYASVRHPIYTGIFIAMLGSAIGVSPFWLLPLVLFGIYFVYSARKEEKLMMAQFPEQYPQYMSRTKMFVPFIL
jgi:protein-S-isoprenylcysteine O-methyltransferase Ste14